MSTLPVCPNCQSPYTYELNDLYVCPECGHEWPTNADTSGEPIICDSNNNPLQDGDSVIIIKDLKVKGSSSSIKKGTKVKSIRLVHDASDGHDIDCKIDGFGAMKLKSSVVKKG